MVGCTNSLNKGPTGTSSSTKGWKVKYTARVARYTDITKEKERQLWNIL